MIECLRSPALRSSRIALSLCVAALLCEATLNWASAGLIETVRTPTCDVRLSNDIEAGDAEKLIAALETVDTRVAPTARLRGENEIERDIYIPRLCLNSKGGRFDEALKFVRATIAKLSFATIIESKAECYSACAIIFLAGHLNQGDGYFELYRRLDVDGQLGFHAPYIPAVGGEASDKLLSASYRAGVLAVAELLNLDGKFFPRSLLSEFLKVGPNEFFRIDRIGQLAAWDIGLTGYKRSTTVSETHIEHVCNNQRLRDNSNYYYAPLLLGGVEDVEREPGETIRLGEKLLRRVEGTIEGVAGCTVLMRLHDGNLFLYADTLSENAGTEEAVAVEREGSESFVSDKVLGNLRGVDPDDYTAAYFLYPVYTKIASLDQEN